MQCVRYGKMPAKTSLKSFPATKPISSGLPQMQLKRKDIRRMAARVVETVIASQNKLKEIEETTGLDLSTIKEINRRMSIGEARARRAKRNGGSQPAFGYFDCEKYTNRARNFGFNSRRQHRFDESGR